jgi:hypothetical protein
MSLEASSLVLQISLWNDNWCKLIEKEDGKTNNFNFSQCPESIVERTFGLPIFKIFAGKTNAVGAGFSSPTRAQQARFACCFGGGPHRQQKYFSNKNLHRSAIQLFYPQ